MRFSIFLFIGFSLIFLQNCDSSTSPKQHEDGERSSSLYDYDVEKKLATLGIVLKEPKAYKGVPIEHYVLVDNMLYLSGKGPVTETGERITGKLGTDLSIEEGREAARRIAISQLEVIKSVTGDLNKVKKVVKVLGMVNSAPDFIDQPKVINGFSDLMIEAFGDRGRHARSAVGMASLPSNIACEIEAIVEIEK